MTVPASVPRDVVAVGASAGGVEALKVLTSGLPADLPATELVGLRLPGDRAQPLLRSVLNRDVHLTRLPSAAHRVQALQPDPADSPPDALGRRGVVPAVRRPAAGRGR